MSAAHLVAELAQRGIRLWAEGERLCFRAPSGALTADLRSRLASHKAEVLALLQPTNGGQAEPETALPDLALPAVVPAPAERHEPFPMTDLQQAYWLGGSDLFGRARVHAHSYVEYELRGFDLDRLDHAWQRLIERHDMLRMMVMPDGRQRILPRVPAAPIAVDELRGLPAGEQEARQLATRDRMCREGPPAGSWPLFELRASRLGERDYQLHWNCSLILCDAWSCYLLAEELFRLYREPRAELAPLAISFRDVALALRRFEGAEPYRQALHAWCRRLDALPPAPDLPLARPPESLPAIRFERRNHQLAPDLWARLRARARQARVTPSAALCAAYAAVLATWCRRRRVTLNLLFFNRLPIHPQIDRLVGNLSSTLLLEVNAAGATFAERAAAVQQQLWHDLRHSQVSGVRVLREIGRRQGGAAQPLMPVVFASNLGAAFESPEEARAGARLVFSHLQTAHVWLDHQAFEMDGGLRSNWDAVAGLWPDGLVDDMFRAYGGLLEHLAGEQGSWDRPLPPLVPPAQLRRRAEVNATAGPRAAELLHEPFFRQAAARPDHPAVIAGGRTLSYGELARRSRSLAHRLRGRGAAPGTLVAVLMERGWEQVVAVLGILEAGAAYLPLDPAWPAERLRHLLRHGEVELVLTQSRIAGRLPDGVEGLAVDRDEPPADGAAPAPLAGPGDLAYVLYTSGSTGLPKGVMIEHRAAANTVLDLNERSALGPADRVLGLSALTFDLSVYDVFGTFAAGATLVLPDAAADREPAHWLERMESTGVTLWNSVPALMQMLVDYLEGEERPLPRSLRHVLLSGDWIPVTLPDRLRARGSPAAVTSLGGATEAAIWSIFFPIGEVDPGWRSIPYGRPLRNQTFHVLDPGLEPCPVWVPGDLYIGGRGLARGYWRDPEKTAASFLAHPETGERLYRTGDLGRYLPDGDIEFLGREDCQVKVAGYRIELEEIEAALLRHPGVQQAVVTAPADARGDRRLVGHVVPAPGTAPGAEELGDFLRRRLPGYMVPARLHLAAALPLSANGKVDRGALLAAGGPAGGDAPAAAFVAPRDETEARLAGLWEELLEVRPVGVTASFFELGGHSLLVVRLMAGIKRLFGRALSHATLLEEPTVEHLAAVLRREPGAASPDSSSDSILVPLQAGGTRRPFFCVHPSGGSVLCYLDLARQLGEEQPFYAFASPGIERGDPLATVEELAELYLGPLRAVQPAGPYRLGGWSMGGVVAFEMARRLLRDGEAVDLLALIDTAAPGEWEPAALDEAALEDWFERDLARLAGADLSREDEEIRRLRMVFKANFRALLAYRPEPFPGSLVLLRATDGAGPERRDPALGWGRWAAAGVDVCEIAGDHYDLLRPPRVAELGRELARRLARG